jgi:isoleucyl-tRNA synthetase
VAPKLSKLRTMSDEEIEQIYDKTAPNTVVGTDFYLDELSRRAFRRASDAALEEAQSAKRLAVVNAVVAVIAVIVAVVVPLLDGGPRAEPCITVVGEEQRPALCLVP